MLVGQRLRSLIPATFVLVVGFAIGADWPGIDGLLIASSRDGRWQRSPPAGGRSLALRFKSQSAAPLMQAGMLLLILTTTAYAPLALLQGWLHDGRRVNPVTQVVEAARQGFVGSVTWATPGPGSSRSPGSLAVLGALALRGMRRTAV